MNRRAFLKTAAGAGALTATYAVSNPAISQRAAARALRFVPRLDLANFDPVWNTAQDVRNAGALVWDMLMA
jgi:peptide/nickel transport system substrate-binding protein